MRWETSECCPTHPETGTELRGMRRNAERCLSSTLTSKAANIDTSY